ncbi:glycosyltransferase [Pelagibacteraceae bacterium]|nr:glycosyltransferase [Pelagibacteraceae bacterium]
MNNFNQLTIILVSYKSEKKINSFVKNIPKKLKIIIIENSKNYLLKKKLEKKYKNIKVFVKENEGVSSSINYAAKKIKTKYFLQISPDIIFNYKDISIFFRYAKKLNDRFSALGPRFTNVNKKSHKQINKNIAIGEIDSIHGSCMFINKKKFNEIGGFDKNFFLYFEETEYCYRALKKELKSYQINNIKVQSQGRTVFIKNKKEKKILNNLLIWHFIWSKYYYHKKRFGQITSLIIFIPLMIRTNIKIIINRLVNNKEKIEKYTTRLDGLMSSIKGKKSSLRP